MELVKKLTTIWNGLNYPFLIHNNTSLIFAEIINQEYIDLSIINRGDVVAIIGDFNPITILTILRLIDLCVIVVPLTSETINEHEYFFESAYVNIVIKDGDVYRRNNTKSSIIIKDLIKLGHSGLVLFSTGTTGRPKAILHDFSFFLKRFETPRPTLRTLNFLLFDHIGGINTLFHTLFNKGVVVAPEARTVNSILETCNKYNVEVLPTTPTFLRLMLISGAIPSLVPKSLRVITYGTERMDQSTLDELCNLLPDVDFRQTYGMSELGILRVKSKARNSLFMQIGGENIETKIVNNILYVRSKSKMIGYLNADSPFDLEGWYETKDIVEVDEQYFKIVGRVNDIVNVGGLKFMASEVERVALNFPGISFVKVVSKHNPITGQHVEILVQPLDNMKFDKNLFIVFLKKNLQNHMIPKRITIQNIEFGHRFKKI
jgi:long-chain acyl-CoA synthetase